MKRKNWFWGIFFILATVLLIASQLGSFMQIGFWSLLAAILLVALIIQSLMYCVWVGVFVPVALLYLVFQKPLGWPYLSPWILIISAVMLSIGLHLLVRQGRRGKCMNKSNGNMGLYDSGNVSENEEEYPMINVNFGNVIRYLRTENLRGGKFSVNFGAIELYFDHATLHPEGAVLDLECHFGAIKLYVPKDWPVEDQTQASMGGVDYKNKAMAQPDNSLPKLRLTGNVNMGGVEIVYI